MVRMADADLHLHTLAGGDIVQLAPIFSGDSENILVVWRDTVRVYQVGTGGWLRDLEKSEEPLVAIEFDSNNPKLLYGCPQDGNVIVWRWRSGVREKRIQLEFPNAQSKVYTFHLIPNDEMAYEGQQRALVSYLDRTTQNYRIDTFDLSTGKLVDEFDIPLAKGHQVAISKFNFFATVYRQQLHIGFLRNNTFQVHKNPIKRHFTCVVCHPSEPLIATGDQEGQIRLWRNMLSTKIISTLYHWHATPVQTIAFSEFGSHFYSGGKEFVLVKWTIDRPENKQFLPHLRGAPKQITLGPKNNNIALALSDNQVQLLDSNFELTAVVQSFTFVHDDETGLDCFPCGMKLHPRSQCLVLNGRIGQLQFYSTQTQSLLYNIDITKENALAAEHDKVIFNTRVTKVALSEDWMVTSECWNDEERSLHMRIKFWQFDDKKQNYALNTNVLMPHDQDLTALELSTVHRAETVYCASAGGDRVLKLWTNNREVYGKGNVWNCVGQRSYKSLPIGNLCFSKDGSVLIVGFGRHVVLFKGNNLRDIRCVLTAPSGLDGTISQLGVIVPSTEGGRMKTSPKKRSKKSESGVMSAAEAIELVNKYLKAEDGKEKEELRKKIFGSLSGDNKSRSNCKELPELSEDQHEIVFEKIYDSLDLDLEQKIKTFNGLGLEWGIRDNYQEQRDKLFGRFHERDEKLEEAEQLLRESKNYRTLRDRFGKMAVAKQLMDSPLTDRPRLLPKAELDEVSQTVTGLRQSLLNQTTEIKSINLGVGEFAHLLIVTTRNRVLIWNLVTLKIQTILKLSCQHICIDPISGLVAAFTENKQLFVFPPNCPIPVYGRKNIPETYGAVWVPRKVQRNNYSDWQAASQLVFLTRQQELMCFVSDADEEVLGASMAHLQSYQSSHTPFGAFMVASQQNQRAGKFQQAPLMNGSAGGALLLKKSTAKELINLLPHAMAPLHILCKGYLSSVLNKAGDHVTQSSVAAASASYKALSSNGDSEKMDVDSDSEVEILVSDTTTTTPTNGTPSPKSSASNGTAASLSTQNHFNSKVESKLKKIAKVELRLSV